jgi:hypothetical protein
MTISSVPICLAMALASLADLATEPLGTPTPYCVYECERFCYIGRRSWLTGRLAAIRGRRHYLAQEIGGEVLVDAQGALLLGHAGQAD